MPNSDYYYVLDLDSGTYFSVSRAVLINSADLSEDELDVLENGSDMDRSELGDEVGTYLPQALGWEPDFQKEEVVS